MMLQEMPKHNSNWHLITTANPQPSPAISPVNPGFGGE
jgi:hypothetical protein